MSVLFSIIIPVKELNDYVRETVRHILNLEFRDWELLIITNADQESEWLEDKRIRVLESGRIGPADKRDMGSRLANGTYLVFLDDDSYPDKNFLTFAKASFETGEIAIGGPAITPLDDSFLQRVSGAVFSSRFTGGSPSRYRSVDIDEHFDDWPSVNFLILKEAFLAVDGFGSPYWPGEDTFLCLKLFKKGIRIKYIPQMIVWHHRREGLWRHIKQVGGYGLHRGYFANRHPETSRRLQYFLPSAVFLMLATSVFAINGPDLISNLYIAGVSIYLLSLCVGIIDLTRIHGLAIAVVAIPYIVFTHLSYGFWFIRGFLMRKELISKLR